MARLARLIGQCCQGGNRIGHVVSAFQLTECQMCDVCFAKHHQVRKTQVAHCALGRVFCIALVGACRL